MVENDFAVAESTAEAGQIETVTVSVMGSQEDNVLKGRVSKELRAHGTIFQFGCADAMDLLLGLTGSERRAEKAQCNESSCQTHGEADG
jgi:hypothetical protein